MIYNWQGNSGYGGEGMNVNLVNNYYKPGPATTTNQDRIVAIWNRIETWDPLYNVWGKFHIDGNVVVGSETATNDNWTYGVQFDSKWSHISDAERQNLRLEKPLETGVVTTHAAEEAYQKVLQLAGASLARDMVDQRIIHDVSTGTAACMDGGNGSTHGFIDTQEAVGGWPELRSLPAPTDTDGDGMPDEWETANELDPRDPSDGKGDANNDGYTHVEDYLNSLTLQYYDTKPSISTISPERNALFINPTEATIEVEVYANDYNGGSITELELYSDEQLVKKVSHANQIVATLKGVSHGMHHITAKATDNTGNMSTDTTTVYVGTKMVRVNIEEDARNGRVKFEPEGGIYAEGIDVTIEAIPDEGYHFQGWIKDIESEEKRLKIKTTDDITLKPVFAAKEDHFDRYKKKRSRSPSDRWKVFMRLLVTWQMVEAIIQSNSMAIHTVGLRDTILQGHTTLQSQTCCEQATMFLKQRAATISWGIALPKGIYRLKLGLGAKEPQGAIKVNLGQMRVDVPPLAINDPIEKDEYKEYVLDPVEIKDGGSGHSDARLTLSSANQTEIYFIEVEPVKFTGKRRLRVINGRGSGTYHDFSGPVMITADPPDEGRVFDKWIGNAEPQYFEEIDKWNRNTRYIEDIYDSTTFVTILDYITSVRATYREK